MRIKYVGTKALKKDVMAGTGLYWAGHGDIKTVDSPEAAAKLLAYPEMFVLADAEQPPQEPVAPLSAAIDQTNDALLDAIDLDAPLPPEDDEQNKPPVDIAQSVIDEERGLLMKRAEAVGLEVNPRWGIPTLAKRVEQAEAAKAKD